ncbi:MAG: type II toxin-antitoxin system RelE/ParE family toxin [Acetobacteraceae bacterium]
MPELGEAHSRNGSPAWMPPRERRSLWLARLEQGNLPNVKPVGEGVLEYRIDWGPGYRVYFGRDGEVLVVLLTGGTKRPQQRDIEAAKALWADYKRRRPHRR